MIYPGVDITNNTHAAAAMSTYGEVFLSPFSFSSDIAGFSLLENKHALFPKVNLVVGMGFMVHYAENLIFVLFNRGIGSNAVIPVLCR